MQFIKKDQEISKQVTPTKKELNNEATAISLTQTSTASQCVCVCVCVCTYLQCFSTLLDNAIFSPTSVQTGCVSAIFAKSALTALTFPPVLSEPIFTINTSFLLSF